MDRGFEHRLKRIYEREGKELFANDNKFLTRLQQLQKDYRMESCRISMAVEKGIVRDMLKDVGNSPELSRIHIYAGILEETYHLSYEDSLDIINTLTLVIFNYKINIGSDMEIPRGIYPKEIAFKVITKITFRVWLLFLIASIILNIYNSSEKNFMRQFVEAGNIIVLGIEPISMDEFQCNKIDVKINIDEEISESVCLIDKEGEYYVSPEIIKKIWTNVTDIKEIRRYGISKAKKKVYDDNFYNMEFDVLRSNTKDKVKLNGYYEKSTDEEHIYVDLREVVVGNLAYTYYIDSNEALVTIYSK